MKPFTNINHLPVFEIDGDNDEVIKVYYTFDHGEESSRDYSGKSPSVEIAAVTIETEFGVEYDVMDFEFITGKWLYDTSLVILEEMMMPA